MNSLCVKHLSIEVSKRSADTTIPHQQICNVLKYIRYIQRFDIVGAERELSPRAIRYILKQLTRFGICVQEFRLIFEGAPGPASKDLIGTGTALFEYQSNQQPCRNIAPGMCEEWFTDNVGEDGITALLKCGHTRIILQFKDTLQRLQPEYPLYLSHDDHVYGTVFLSAEGTILGCEGEILCPANRFKHYLNSTSKKRRQPQKR